MGERENHIVAGYADWYQELLDAGCQLKIGDAVPYGHNYTIIPPPGKECVIEKGDDGKIIFIIQSKK